MSENERTEEKNINYITNIAEIECTDDFYQEMIEYLKTTDYMVKVTWGIVSRSKIEVFKKGE